MIIKKNIKQIKKTNDVPVKEQIQENQTKSSLLKKQDLISAAKEKNKKTSVVEENEQEIKEQIKEDQPKKLDDFEKIDISEIEFTERIERRRGDRRRGYRRIDERSLVTRAQQEAHNIKELAAREGYQNGLKQANGELDKIKNTLLEFLEQKNEMYEKFYPHIVEIALDAAEKIIKKEVELSQDILKNVVMGAMDELNADTQRVEIKVNSADVEFARVSLPEIIETNYQGIKISITQDDKIQRGSCVVIANNGVIDASFNTQLAVLQNAFGIYKGGI